MLTVVDRPVIQYAVDAARAAGIEHFIMVTGRGKAAIDSVHLDITDRKRLTIEATDAAASGFTATACIHPSHVDIIRAAYRPDEKTVAWATAVLAEPITAPVGSRRSTRTLI